MMMKLQTTIFAVLALTGVNLAAEKRLSADDHFRQGEVALELGQIEQARASYAQALTINPQHGNARYRLVSLKNLSAEIKVKLRKKKFAAISVPKIAFEDVPLKEALEAFGVLVEQSSGDTFVPNFVLDDPTSALGKRPITLSLKNVPANVGLKYILSQAGAREVWSEHVVTVRALARASEAAPEVMASPQAEPEPFKWPLQKKK